MVNLKDFIMNNIDVVLVVNKDFEVIYNSRFDERMGATDKKMTDYKEYKNLFEMYPKLGRNNSTIAKTMSTGEVVINESQEFIDAHGKVYITQNITFPIYRGGKIAGIVELTKDLTTMKDIESKELIRNKLNETNHGSILSNNRTITYEDILTVDDEMIRAIEHAKLYAEHIAPILVYGETGTGKELFVQAMVNQVKSPKQNFIVQNCAAVPDNLIEAILFGTTSGSYTGAENKKGLFDEADGGFLFLDELNSLSYEMQGKLLRVVQDGTFRPIGSNIEKKVNVKIIAAMNIDPMDAIKAKILRKDLFYRLSSSMIYLPPLRDRKADIEYLINIYIDLFNSEYGKHVEGISDDLKDLFFEYRWEGNVRELKHVIESMIRIAKDTTLSRNEIPLYLHNKIEEAIVAEKEKAENNGAISSDGQYDLNEELENIERKLIIQTLNRVNGNKTKAGQLLNIPRQTLKYRMVKLGIGEEWSN